MLPLLDDSKNTSRRPDVRPFTRGALGLDVCLSLTTRVHRVRFPAGAPDPRVGLPVAGHHRYGSPTQRASTAPRANERGRVNSGAGSSRLPRPRSHSSAVQVAPLSGVAATTGLVLEWPLGRTHDRTSVSPSPTALP